MALALSRPVNSNHYLSGTYVSGLCGGYSTIGSTYPSENSSPSYIRRGTKSQKINCADGKGIKSSYSLVNSGDDIKWSAVCYVMSGQFDIVAWHGVAGTVIYTSAADAGWVNVSSSFPCQANTIQISVRADVASATIFIDELHASRYVELHPEYDFELQDKVNRSEDRTLNGTLYSYQFASWKRWELPVSFVNSYERSIITSWWSSQSTLFFNDIDHELYPSSYHVVKLMNKTSPFDKYQKPYFLQKFQGDLILETL